MNTTAILPQPGQFLPEHNGKFISATVTPAGEVWGMLYPTDVPELPKQAWGKYGQHIELADSATNGLANTTAMAVAGNELAQAVLALPGNCYLPSRVEALQLFAVLAGEIGTGAVWTSTQYSAGGAWAQDFYGGGQYVYLEDCELRAVPVRCIQID